MSIRRRRQSIETTTAPLSVSLRQAIEEKSALPPRAHASPSSELVNCADMIAERTRVLQMYARELADASGISMMEWDLDPPAEPGEQTALAVLLEATRTRECASIERVKGEWTLVYRRYEPQSFTGPAKLTLVPMVDAPLGTRELFLRRSEDFFLDYIGQMTSRLGCMRESIEAGDRTIRLLESLRRNA
jgi:hypothetical protein